MQQFLHKFTVSARLAEVVKFHQDSRALKKLTPPPVIVQMHQVEPLAEGSVAKFTLWMGPLPVRWLARHEQVDMPKGFVDVQEHGPFRIWRHQHTFRYVNENTTEVIDEVQAEMGKGIPDGLISRLMWFSLPLLFAYRAWITRRMVLRG
jgi:ligand-binding SRPBCC domain-containing protein